MQESMFAEVSTVAPQTAGLREEITRLDREHRELKARLSELNARLYLSPDEEIERKTIQKLKLVKKDRLALLMAQAEQS